MLKDHYSQGVEAALRLYGVKLAAPRDEEDHTTRNLLMAGAAAAPFAGMIGQAPLIHDPFNAPKQLSREALLAQARAGDLLVTTQPKMNIYRAMMEPATGTPFYHAQPILGQGPSGPSTISAGQFNRPQHKGKLYDDLMRSTRTLEDVLTRRDYDVALMRPKSPLTPEQVQAFVGENIARASNPYSLRKAISSWANEAFVPKWNRLRGEIPSLQCKGDICSTMPAEAYAKAGIPGAVPYKKPSQTLATDFLRSNNFDMVGAYVRDPKAYASPAMRKAMPYLGRAGIGALLAGGVYGGAKLLRHHQEQLDRPDTVETLLRHLYNAQGSR